RRLVQLKTEKGTQRQRVACPPCNPALGIDAFEISDQQRTEVNARRQSGTAHLRIEIPTCGFGKGRLGIRLALRSSASIFGFDLRPAPLTIVNGGISIPVCSFISIVPNLPKR